MSDDAMTNEERISCNVRTASSTVDKYSVQSEYTSSTSHQSTVFYNMPSDQ